MPIYYGDKLVSGEGGVGTPDMIPAAIDIQQSTVYILTDDQNRIIRCDGGYSMPADLTGWIKIDEGTGDKYNL